MLTVFFFKLVQYYNMINPTEKRLWMFLAPVHIPSLKPKEIFSGEQTYLSSIPWRQVIKEFEKVYLPEKFSLWVSANHSHSYIQVPNIISKVPEKEREKKTCAMAVVLLATKQHWNSEADISTLIQEAQKLPLVLS